MPPQSTPDTLPVHAVKNLLEVDEKQMKRRSEVHVMFQDGHEGVDVASVLASRAKTRLLFLDQATCPCQDFFHHYLYDGTGHANET